MAFASRTLLLPILLFLLGAGVHAQSDTLLLMNGQKIGGRVLGQSTLEVRYLEFGRNGRIKERSEPTESVFSVTDSLGREKVWYFHDTVFGNDFTVDQMRWYIKGEQDARKGYKPFWPMAGGFLVGAGATIGFNLEVNSLMLPPIYGGLMVLPRVHVTPGSLTDLSLEGDEHYAYGYARQGRGRRVTRSILSTFAGVVVGLAVRQLIINPNLEGY
jgi:hypothetical protein